MSSSSSQESKLGSSEDDDTFFASPDGLISAGEGLSPDVLAALMQFQSGGFIAESCFEDDPVDSTSALETTKDIVDVATHISKSTSAGDVIAETYRRLEEKADAAAKAHEKSLYIETITDLVQPHPPERSNLVEILQREGVVRINRVLDLALCDPCLASINEKLDASDTSESDEKRDGFGKVFSRHARYDMYLRPEGIYDKVLTSLFSSGTVLGELFQALIPDHSGGFFHEFSSLSSDPGAGSQRVHPDSPYSKNAAMWTVFVALQDVSVDMGPTILLLGTHTKESHDNFNSPEPKEKMLMSARYRQSVLNKGDCIVMDSRTMHLGSENESMNRRTLLYCTIRNPVHGDKDEDFPDCGSLFPDLSQQITTSSYYSHKD